jgi:hypothetical protein
MPVNFLPKERSSFDDASGVSIAQPRILPATLPDGRDGVEYQFTFRQDGEMIGGLGCLGTDELGGTADARARTFTMDLGRTSALDSIFRLKVKLGNEDALADFVRECAKGLVNTFVGQNLTKFEIRYIAFTRLETLQHFGVEVPAAATILPDGIVVLAEAVVPPYAAPEAQG